ncbi:MAG: TonB-dependent receptor [Acidobacteria bacterium]|nr:TonB-dependent receptor [Acidobacteriota bacterium]
MMTLHRRATIVVVAWAVALLPAIHSQVVTGTMLGTVTDSSGAVVAGAKVEVRNIDTNQVRSLATNSAGTYVAANLPIGNYEVAVEQPGFSRQVRTRIRLDVDQRVRMDIQLVVGERTEVVEVQAGAPLIKTETSEEGQVVGRIQVEELPLNGRNFVQLVTLTTGVGFGVPGQSLHGNSPSAFRSDTAVSINAGRADQNNFLLDGVDNNEADVNTIVIIPIVDGIQEFKVITGNFSAEYGRAAGAVISVQTKSGTNEFHGSLFEFHRNAAVDAKNYFDDPNRDIPKFIQNQFGGAIGGPIVRSRTFFFADYQGARIRKGETLVGTVPTALMRTGNFSEVTSIPVLRNPFGGIFFGKIIPPGAQDPVAQSLMQLYPEPNQPGIVNNFINNPVTSRRDEQFDVRRDRKTCGSRRPDHRHS